MAPIWPKYFGTTRKIMFVVDASNLSQLGIATMQLMELLSHPHTQFSKVFI